MTNFYLGMVIIALFTISGYKYSVRFRERKNFFKDMFSFNELMINEMSFRKNTLLEIYKKTAYKSKFSEVLSDYLIERQRVPQLEILKDDELDFIDGYFSALGRSDSNSQLKMLETAKGAIKNYVNIADGEFTKYSKLCVKLSFLFGLMVFLIII